MLYFVKPFGGLEWTGDLGQNVIDMAREKGIDLGTQTDWWQPAERPSNDDDIRVAIRHGIAASGGIVVAATHIVTVQGPSEFRALAARSSAVMAAYREDPQVKSIDEVMEQLSPGWTQHGRDLDQGVAASMRDTLREREAEAAEELEAAVDAGLLRHWELVGGAVPSPM